MNVTGVYETAFTTSTPSLTCAGTKLFCFDHTIIGTVSSGAGQPAGWRHIGFGRASQHAALEVQHSARGGMEHTEGEGENPATEAVMQYPAWQRSGRRDLTIP